jgi:hypothetical protein
VDSSYSNSHLLTIDPPTITTGICVRYIPRAVPIGIGWKVAWNWLNRDAVTFDWVPHLDPRFVHVGYAYDFEGRLIEDIGETKQTQLKKGLVREADARKAKRSKCVEWVDNWMEVAKSVCYGSVST